jgi:hypothetical protein
VRVAYSRESLTQGRMGITVASFMQEGDGLQGRGLTIIDPPKDGDCLYPTFVQPDVVTTATLYWIESSGTQLRARFRLPRRRDLDLPVRPVGGFVGSDPILRRRRLYAEHFFHDSSLQFVPCWPQRNPSKGRIEVQYG